MKLLRVGEKGFEKPACLDKNGHYRDLSEHISDFSHKTLSLASLSQLKTLKIDQLPILSSDMRIGCAIADVPNFYCIGLNYAKHAAETNSPLPPEPLIFNKATSALNGPMDSIIIPKGSTKIDWEVELGVVIGKGGSYIPKDNALSHIAGYCTINDVSEREFQKNRGGQWIKGKSAPSFAPVGPYIVTADEIKNPQNLSLQCSINGEVKQQSTTKDMIFSVAEIISSLSHYFKLRVGDIIATGTPEGVGIGQKPTPQFLKAGDKVEAEVEGLGRQNLNVCATI